MANDDEAITSIELDADEALVLFDLLSRWEQDDTGKPYPADDCFESPAEVHALVAILGKLEAQLVAPFQHEYLELVEAARMRLIIKGGDDITLNMSEPK